jgi:four helix bundle protein
MQDPENLRVAGIAERLARDVYAFVRTLPASERSNLIPQLQKSATSASWNIEESCGRQSNRAMLPFLHYANSSAGEMIAQLRFAEGAKLGDHARATKLKNRALGLKIKIAKLITAIRRRIEEEGD